LTQRVKYATMRVGILFFEKFFVFFKKAETFSVFFKLYC
jgi:hypothetical protein